MIRLLILLLVANVAAAQTPTFSTVASNAYASGDINSCAIALNNLATVGGYQFLGYYDNANNLRVARRTSGAATWTVYSTGISIAAVEIANDHNIIAMGFDANGKLHLTWNMHNRPLNYSISNTSVLTSSLPSMSLTQQTSTNMPSLFPSSGTTTNLVTYPVFLNVPNSNNLMFLYRNGGTGGGSGNGNEYLNIYNPATNTFTNNLIVNGIANSVNAYLNRPVYDSQGRLHITWTWRSTSNWQTNSNIMYARSSDNGATWTRFNGTPYTLPIVQSGAAASVGEVIKTIPQNSSFINQTAMAVDNNDRPIVATWWATTTGNPNRQYAVVYHDGSSWRTSQIFNRNSDTAVDTSGNFVRDVARPLVLVDDDNRVLVVTRSVSTAMGSYSSASTPGNNIMVYYSENLMSATPTWNGLVLDSTNMGNWEPTYDAALWESENKLSLVWQVTGQGSASSTLRVLDWDARAFFTPVPEPAWLLIGLLFLRRR